MLNASYKGICEKLGFDPLANPVLPKGDEWLIDDNEENIFGVLNEDEIALLLEIGVALQNIRQAVGLY